MPLLKNTIFALNLFSLFRVFHYLLPSSVLLFLPRYRHNQLWQCFFILCFLWALSINHNMHSLGLSILSFYLLVLSIFDADYLLLPDNFTFSLLISGLIVNNSPYYFIDFNDSINGLVAGFLLFYLTYWLSKYVYRQEALGFGDVKLFSGLGAWCGLEQLPYILFLASMFGIVMYGVLFFTAQNTINKIAFGPCLAFATLIVLGVNMPFV